MHRKIYNAPDPVSREEMQSIDETAIEEMGFPGLLLMENAGSAVASSALELFNSRGLDRVCVVAGTGNNGGDGFVAARHLQNLDQFDEDVTVFYTGDVDEDKGRGDAGRNLEYLELFDVPVREVDPGNAEDWLPEPDSSTLVIDALFGTGLSEDVRAPYDHLIETINDTIFPVVSVDVPSGLDVDAGRPLGVAVEAYLTVTLGAAKKGLLEERARAYVGSLNVVDIQIPRHLLDNLERDSES